MSSRWFSRLMTLDDPFLLKEIEQSPVHGVLDQHFMYIEKEGLCAIIIRKEAWRKGPQTWWRKDIRNGLRILLGMRGSTAVDVALVWSRIDELYAPNKCVRIMDNTQVLREISLAWYWIAHICQQPVRVQKDGGLAAGVEEWAAKQRRLAMPSSP